MKDPPAGRRSFDVAGSSSHTNEGSALLSDTSEDCKDQSGVLSRRRCCAICSLSCLLLLVLLVIVRIVQKRVLAAKLQPLLDALESEPACSDPSTSTCALAFDARTAERFDLHPAENPLFGYIFRQLARSSRERMAEILCGGHVVTPDEDGQAYQFLTTLPGAYERISSHASDRKQYGIDEGRVVSTILIGAVGNSTWFQLEGSPWSLSDPVGSVGHCVDFVEYRLTGRNVGPLGTSEHTDQQPLVLETPYVPTSRACPAPCEASARSLLETRSAARRRGVARALRPGSHGKRFVEHMGHFIAP